MPATWHTYGVDGDVDVDADADADGDGRADPDNPADAIFSAAAYLRASGAPADLTRAIFAYNHADWYVERVLTTARRYAQTSNACVAGTGAVRIAPAANRPGHPLASETLAFLERMAALYGDEIVVTTGTNHSTHTVDGRVSDHTTGHAADLGMAANGGHDDSPVGDRLMAACLTAGGLIPEPTSHALAACTRSNTTDSASSASGRPTRAATTTTTCTPQPARSESGSRRGCPESARSWIHSGAPRPRDTSVRDKHA